MKDLKELEKYLDDPNIKKFQDLLGYSEGTDKRHGYNTLVGGKKVDDLTDHPNIVGLSTKDGKSTAFGRYQIVNSTWKSLKKEYDFPDFSEKSQDLAMIALLKRRGALADVIRGDMKSAVNKTGSEWVSLPSSTNKNQGKISWKSAEKILASSGAPAANTPLYPDPATSTSIQPYKIASADENIVPPPEPDPRYSLISSPQPVEQEPITPPDAVGSVLANRMVLNPFNQSSSPAVSGMQKDLVSLFSGTYKDAPPPNTPQPNLSDPVEQYIQSQNSKTPDISEYSTPKVTIPPKSVPSKNSTPPSLGSGQPSEETSTSGLSKADIDTLTKKYMSGELNKVQKDAFTHLVSIGDIPNPDSSFKQEAEDGRSLFQKGKDFVTGNDKHTKETNSLSDYGDMPEAKTAKMTAYRALTNDSGEIADAIIYNNPKVSKRVDEKGNIILKSGDGKEYAMKSGFTKSDIPYAVANLATLATGGIGGKVATTIGKQALKSAAISGVASAAGEVGKKVLGDTDINPLNVVGSAAIGGAVPIAVKGVSNIAKKITNKVDNPTGSNSKLSVAEPLEKSIPEHLQPTDKNIISAVTKGGKHDIGEIVRKSVSLDIVKAGKDLGLDEIHPALSTSSHNIRAIFAKTAKNENSTIHAEVKSNISRVKDVIKSKLISPASYDVEPKVVNHLSEVSKTSRASASAGYEELKSKIGKETYFSTSSFERTFDKALENGNNNISNVSEEYKKALFKMAGIDKSKMSDKLFSNYFIQDGKVNYDKVFRRGDYTEEGARRIKSGGRGTASDVMADALSRPPLQKPKPSIIDFESFKNADYDSIRMGKGGASSMGDLLGSTKAIDLSVPPLKKVEPSKMISGEKGGEHLRGLLKSTIPFPKPKKSIEESIFKAKPTFNNFLDLKQSVSDQISDFSTPHTILKKKFLKDIHAAITEDLQTFSDKKGVGQLTKDANLLHQKHLDASESKKILFGAPDRINKDGAKSLFTELDSKFQKSMNDGNAKEFLAHLNHVPQELSGDVLRRSIASYVTVKGELKIDNVARIFKMAKKSNALYARVEESLGQGFMKDLKNMATLSSSIMDFKAAKKADNTIIREIGKYNNPIKRVIVGASQLIPRGRFSRWVLADEDSLNERGVKRVAGALTDKNTKDILDGSKTYKQKPQIFKNGLKSTTSKTKNFLKQDY